MATPVIMPRQGQSVESCIIAKWHKKLGDVIHVGDVLFTYETDKATFDEEAKVEGVLLAVFFEEGDDIPVLTNVCVIGNEGESTAEFNPNAGNAPTADVKEGKPVAAVSLDSSDVSLVELATMNTEEKLKISPRARNLAEKSGIDYRYAVPTGPYGRIMERDILSLQQDGPIITPSAMGDYVKLQDTQGLVSTGLGGRITTADIQNAQAPQVVVPTAANGTQTAVPIAEYEVVKLTNIRKVISKAMQNSLSTTAQLTLNASFDATDMIAYRKKLKDNKDRLGLENITLNDIILYAVSRTIISHKMINAHFLDDKMHLFNNVHLGIAVDTDRGLMVPTLFNANLKSLNEISKEAKMLIEECQKGTINPDYLKGASFTITNLGTLDVESFTPVINPPQAGILGVNNIMQRVKEAKGEYSYYPAMGLSLTFDHRALDGAPAARFLKDLKTNLENFSILLAK